MQPLQAQVAASDSDRAAAMPEVPKQILEQGPGPKDPARPAGEAARLDRFLSVGSGWL
jgi:hypothetical protein